MFYFSSLRRPARWSLPILALLALSSAGSWAASPDIEIKGGPSFLRDNVRSFIAIGEEPCSTPEWRMRARLRELDKQIQNAAKAVGYYNLESTRELTQEDDCWGLKIRLEPGKPVRLNQIDIRVEGEGKDDAGFQEIIAKPGLSEGDRLDHGRYESLKSRFGTVASARGFFEGRFSRSRVTVDVDQNSAHLELVYQSGPRYEFGEISFKHDILSEAFLRRYLNFEPGEPYHIEKLLDLKSYYGGSDYFSYIGVSPRLQQLEGQRVPVAVELEGRARHGYSAGVGYATDTGARILLGYENRYINKRGHSFNADLKISELGGSLGAAYHIPMSRPAQERLSFYTGFKREDTDDTRSEVTTIGTSYSRSEENSPWLQNYSINYEREDYIVGGEPEERSHLLIPSVSLSRTKSDESSYPPYGWRVLGRLSGSPSTLGSKVSFVQAYFSGKYIHSIGPGRVLLRLEGGITEVDDFSLLPVSQRFFAGGDTRVRGYDYNSLGPTTLDPETNEELVIGGSNLLVNSIEYDYRFLPSWAGAVFYDQGNAFNGSEFDFKRSAGVGVRWLSPIGPVRIDVAKALDEPHGWGLHLSMGPDL